MTWFAKRAALVIALRRRSCLARQDEGGGYAEAQPASC